jgi:hypothetical protein
MRIFTSASESSGSAMAGRTIRCGDQHDPTTSRQWRDMAEKRPKRPKKGESTECGGKISLYGLSIEDALRAAAKTGRTPPLESQKPKVQRKERTKTGLVA